MSRAWILTSGSSRIGTLPAGTAVKRVRRVIQQLATALGKRVSAKLGAVVVRKARRNSSSSTRSRPGRRSGGPGVRRSSTKRSPSRRARRRRRSRRNPGAPAAQLEQARRTFERWHGFAPADIQHVKLSDRPEVLVRLGEVAAIEYLSNKWTGRRERYRHSFKKPRPLLCTGPDAKGLEIVGGRAKVTERGLVD